MKVNRWLLGSAFLLLTACTDELHWQEQAYLHDGTLIVVDRYAMRESNGFPLSKHGKILIQELRYSPLGVEWKRRDVEEQLVSFDVFGGVAYLATTSPLSRGKFCNGKRHGEPILDFYRWKDGRRESIESDKAPFAEMRWNLTTLGPWRINTDSNKTFLGWSEIAESHLRSGDLPPEKLSDFIAASDWMRCP